MERSAESRGAEETDGWGSAGEGGMVPTRGTSEWAHGGCMRRRAKCTAHSETAGSPACSAGVCVRCLLNARCRLSVVHKAVDKGDKIPAFVEPTF